MSKWNYYNDIDPFCCEWIRNLIKSREIPDGEIDCRPIQEVSAHDIKGFVQHHWFCGIAGWPLALKLAGWTATQPVWTGSCPCQSFSSAGKKAGFDDARDLWPVFWGLFRQHIRDTGPVPIFGEQVAAAIRFGWLDRVQTDMEAEGYSLGAVVLGAHSVGAPHIRQRLFWVGDSASEHQWRDTVPGIDRQRESLGGSSVDGGVADACCKSGERGTGRLPATEKGVSSTREQDGGLHLRSADGCKDGGLGNTQHKGQPAIEQSRRANEEGWMRERQGPGDAHSERLGNSTSERRRETWLPERETGATAMPACASPSPTEWLGSPSQQGPQGYSRDVNDCDQSGRIDPSEDGSTSTSGVWDQYTIIPCRDNKARRIPLPESGIQPLAYGLPRDVATVLAGIPGVDSAAIRDARRNRVGQLKGYGNAIVPQVAAEFIKATQEAKHGEAKQ